MSFSKKITDLKREVLKESEPLFAHIEDVAEANTLKVLDAMRECRVSDAHFNTTTGYAYDDIGRGKLEELYAKIFGAERALVRTQFVSGTHALATVLFGILRPGDELGASLSNNRLLFQGLFLAPHVVSQAIKGAIFAAGMFAKLGYKTLPLPTDVRGDIIQAIELGSADKLIAFCGGIQKYSPVDSFAAPEPWDMPGYADKIIMAAGTFVQGASIEFSADGPLRAPYNVYLQGGLTFEHAIIGIMGAAQAVLDLDETD